MSSIFSFKKYSCSYNSVHFEAIIFIAMEIFQISDDDYSNKMKNVWNNYIIREALDLKSIKFN